MHFEISTNKQTLGAHRKSWVLRYAIAVLTIAAAAALRLLLQRVVEGATPFLLLFAGMLVSAAFGGLGPGLLATLLATFAGGLVFEDVRMADGISAPEAIRLLLFLCEGMFISVLGARLQAARRRAEQSESEARRLEQKILDISDDERRRIGQDLHDGLGQHLTGVAFLSKALQQRLSNQALPEAADAIKIVRLVSESIGQTRALAKGLVPLGLEDGGLSAALMQLAASTNSVFGVECDLNYDQSFEPVNMAVATHLYRITQEAVNNAVRHGKAGKIEINLENNDGRFRLSIQDDGVGIVTNPDSGGMGLQIMSFRARMIGATLSVHRGSTGGTMVSCMSSASLKRSTN